MKTQTLHRTVCSLLIAGLLSWVASPLRAQSTVEGSRSLVDDDKPRITSVTNRSSGVTHLKGQRFVDVGVGTMDHLSTRPFSTYNAGIGLHLATGRYRQSLSAWRVMASFGRKQLVNEINGATVRIPYALYTVGFGYEFNLLRSADRQRFVRAEFSGLSLYESINNDSRLVLLDNQAYNLGAGSRFGLGLDGALTAEINRFTLGLRQRWVPNANYGRFHTFLSIGIRLTQ